MGEISAGSAVRRFRWGRRTFCSAECVHEWRLRSDMAYVRSRLYERDRGVCSECHLDTRALVQKIEREWDRARARQHLTEETYLHDWAYRLRHGLDLTLEKILKKYKIPMHRWASSRVHGIWDADHIVPVIEGGGLSGLENFRTLCLRCHKGETAKLAHRRAKKRRKLSSSSQSHAGLLP